MDDYVEGGAYQHRDFNTEQGPSTYSDAKMEHRILEISGLTNGDSSQKHILDLMTGGGKVGAAAKREIGGNHKITYLDMNLPKPGDREKFPDINRLIQANVRDGLPVASGSQDNILARYAVKDISQEEQQQIFNEIARALSEDGTFTLIDMVAPNKDMDAPDEPDLQDWLNEQHRLKQKLGGGNVNGDCYIRTEDEWLDLFKKAGMVPSIHAYNPDANTAEDPTAGMFYMSKVTTDNWLNSNQFKQHEDDPMDIQLQRKAEMDEFLLSAPEKVKHHFGIEKDEEGKVHINFPVIMITGEKPAADSLTLAV